MSDEREILVARYFDGSATLEQIEALDRAAASDPALARAMLAAAQEELELRAAFVIAPRRNTTVEVLAGDEGARSLPTNGDSNGNGADKGFVPAAATAARHTSVSITTASTGHEVQPAQQGWRIGRSRWLAVAACLLVAAGVAWIVMRPTAAPPVAKQPTSSATESLATVMPAGPGVTIDRGGAQIDATAGTSITRNDTIRTSGSGSATFAFPNEQTRVTLGASSGLSMPGDEGGKRLALAFGSIACDVQKQQPGRPLVVSTPQARVEVVGTAFQVTTRGGWTRVDVTHGTVRVTRLTDGATVDVSADDYVYASQSPATRPNAVPPGFTVAQGRDMGNYWSTKVRPAGIDR